MKKILLFVGALLIMMSNTSCKKYFEGINDDPNNPLAVTPDVLLSSIEAGIAYGIGGDMSRMTSVFMQQAQGVENQWAAINLYDVKDNDLDNLWRFNLYGGPLKDLTNLMEIAEANEYHHYNAIAKVLMAFTMGSATDVWGDLPYSDAFQGASGNIQPTYDTQESIYDEMEKLLDEAIVSLAGEAGAQSPGSEDFIYNGDPELWIKVAHGIKARFLLHRGDLAGAASEAGMSFSDPSEDFAFPFSSSESFSNPWYQFERDRSGNIMFDGTLQNMIDTVRGKVMIEIGNLGGLFGAPGAPVSLISYAEMQFIIAEALLAADIDASKEAFDNGVSAFASNLDVAVDPSWLSAGVATYDLETIMIEKYYALFLNPESWADYRRTGFPVLSPTSGSTIPTRFNYPESEKLYNTNTPAQPDMWSKVWWNN